MTIGFGKQAFAAICLFGTFALWAAAGWIIVRRIRIAPFHRPTALAATAILAPIAMAQAVTALFWLSPGISPVACVTIMLAVPASAIAFQARPLLWDLRAAYGSARTLTRGAAIGALIGAGLFSLVLMPLAFQLFFLPLHGNDPLEYMQLGRMFAEHRDARLYPILTALPESGFVAPWTHPPTYGVLIALAFMLQGSSLIAGAAKMIGLWFAVGVSALAAALVYAADKRTSWRVWIAPACVLSVPAFFELVQSAHIDAMRIAAFTAAVALGCHLLAAAGTGAAALAGVGLAGAMLGHSIGVLAPAIVLPLIVVCWTGPVRRLAQAVAVMLGIALLFGAPHYVRNIAIFGNPIQDNVPIWDIAALEVKEFLRVSRGLETLLDRLYHGAFMPWTRSEQFGLLPTALLLIAPFAVLKSLRHGGSSLAEAFTARGGSIATQLSIAILGFVALVLLSVFAGSELAIKNARYILTIAPLVVVLTLIAFGVLIEDSRMVDMAKRLVRAIVNLVPRRLLPARLRSMPLFDGLPPPPKGWRASMSGVGDFAAVAIVGWLVFSQFDANLRAAAGNTLIYLDGFGGLSRLVESERMKRDGSRLGDALVERETAAIIPADEKVLLFRQASYGFYASGRFVFHIDRSVEDLFRIANAPLLHRALSERGLRWILTPNFPLPEINNSAFGALLAESSFVRPEFSSEGWTLYALRDPGAAADIKPLAQARPAGGAGGPVFATTERGTGFVDGRRAAVRVDPDGGFVELSRQRGLIRHLDRWDVLLSRPLRTGPNPHDLNVADWYIEGNDPVAVNALVSGKGYGEVAVEYTIHKPLIDAGAPPSGRDDMDVRTMLVREIIWAGVIPERPTLVRGWIVSPLSRLPDGTDRQRRGARILFRLRDGDRLAVHEWAATQVRFPEQQARRERIDSILSAGWSFSASSRNVSRGIELRLPNDSGSERPGDLPLRSAGVFRLTTRPTSILTPSFWQPDVPPAEIERQRSLFNAHLATASLRLEMRGTLAGFGRIVPKALVYCNSQERPAQGIMQGLFTRGDDPEAAPRIVPLPATQLWGEGRRDLIWSEPLPCMPYRVRLLLTSEQQPLLTFEEFLKDPDRARSGFIEVHALQVSLVGGASAGTRSVLPLELRARPAP